MSSFLETPQFSSPPSGDERKLISHIPTLNQTRHCCLYQRTQITRGNNQSPALNLVGEWVNWFYHNTFISSSRYLFVGKSNWISIPNPRDPRGEEKQWQTPRHHHPEVVFPGGEEQHQRWRDDYVQIQRGIHPLVRNDTGKIMLSLLVNGEQFSKGDSLGWLFFFENLNTKNSSC